MKTQVNGIEITSGMAGVLDKWYGTAISYDDTLPFGYVKELGEVQDILCRMICDSDEKPEIKRAIAIIINLKDDLKMFIPDKNNDTNQNN
jgi:hypothetical protein